MNIKMTDPICSAVIRLPFVLVLLAVVTASIPSAVHAESQPWAGLWRVKHEAVDHSHDDDDEDGPRVAYLPQYGSPPPKSQQQAYQVPVARGLPYGFNRGTCDRGAGGLETMGSVPHALGRPMPTGDQGCMASALALLPDNRRITWLGEDGAVYHLMPLNTALGANGRACRDYVASVEADGRRQQASGTACRQPDGRWVISN